MHLGPAIFTVFLLLCRIGACLMIAPGLGNSQIPAQVRVFAVVGLTLSLAPMLYDKAPQVDAPVDLARLVVLELLTGGVIGTLARLFFSALETLAFSAASLLGLANPFGVELQQGGAAPPLATLITMGATALLFVSNFHLQIVGGLVDSYRAIPIGGVFDARRSLGDIGAVLGQAFLVAVRIASPFFLYSVIVNFAIALVNRVTPQVSIFFIAAPFTVSGGVALLYFTVRGEVAGFLAAFSAWLSSF